MRERRPLNAFEKGGTKKNLLLPHLHYLLCCPQSVGAKTASWRETITEFFRVFVWLQIVTKRAFLAQFID